MACTVIFEVRAKPGTGKNLLQGFRDVLPETRNKPGCRGVEVTVNLDDPDNVLLIQRWDSRGHYETYLDWRKQRGDLKSFGEALAAPPNIRFFETTDV